MRFAAGVAAVLVAASDAGAQRQVLRELSTDRPDRTESPITVDRGHAQVELDFVTMTRASGVRSVGFAAVNVKAGVRNDTDLQLVVLGHERSTIGGVTTRATLPDLTARLKHNLWGNDGGRTAFALMPFVTIPTESGRVVEGGLIAPFGADLGRGWGFGAMLELDGVAAESGEGHQLNVVSTVTAGRDVAGPVAAFGELATELRNAVVKTVAMTANGGVTIGAGPNTRFDAGVNVGLNDYADRLRLFVGMARRY